MELKIYGNSWWNKKLFTYVSRKFAVPNMQIFTRKKQLMCRQYFNNLDETVTSTEFRKLYNDKYMWANLSSVEDMLIKTCVNIFGCGPYFPQALMFLKSISMPTWWLKYARFTCSCQFHHSKFGNKVGGRKKSLSAIVQQRTSEKY